MCIILLMLLRVKISLSQKCCSYNDQETNPILIVDQDYSWNYEFTLNKFPIYTLTNLVSIKQESLNITDLVIKKSQTGFQYTLIQNEKKFKQLEQVELGVFQQIFIQYSKQNLEIKWYSDFQIITNHSDFLEESKQLKIFFNEELLCFQQIKNIDKSKFMKECEEKFHIQIKQYPQLIYLQSQSFNNNYYQIQFWIKKKTLSLKHKLVLTIGSDFDQGSFTMVQQYNRVYFHDNHLILFNDTSYEIGWVFFQLTYKLNSGIIKYQRQKQLENINFKQSFKDNVRLALVITDDLIFTGIQLHLTTQNNNILCVPGCLSCDQYGYCLQCEADYIQNGNFCECQENYQFILKPSECYIKLNYLIEQKKEKNINCPQFGGQLCPQCEDDSNQNFRYCLYLTNIQLSYDQLELEYNYYHLYIAYKVEDYSYLPVNNEKQNFKYTNIIYLSETALNFYQIGLTASNHKKCYNGYYYEKRCRQTIKQCKIQVQINYCNICHKNYALLNGKCFRCPKYCQYCQISINILICIKCQQGYFLNFQRKCIPCSLEYCEQCYHYNGQLNTLERNFKIQKQGFIYYLGCSYCQKGITLELDKRECGQNINLYLGNEKSQKGEYKFFYTQSKLYLENMQASCDERINKNCQICQREVCILCTNKHYLDVKNNLCIPNNIGLDIYNSNQLIQDSESFLSHLTFYYYNYNYSDIINQQKSYYLKGCQFNNYETSIKIDRIQCYSELNYIISDNQCPFYCNLCDYDKTCLNYKYNIIFQITFNLVWDQFTPFLNYSNNFVDNLYRIKNQKNKLIEFTLLMDKNSFSLSPQDVFYNQEEEFMQQQFNLKIIFNNTQIIKREELMISGSVIIEDSILNIVDGLILNHNETSQTNQEVIFRITNVQFLGQLNQSCFNIDIFKKIQRIEIENVIISNFSNLRFVLQAQYIYIFNLTLVNLNITYDEFGSFLFFQSQNLIIDSITIINCSIKNKKNFFHLNSLNVILKNMQIIRTKISNSDLISINETDGAQYMEKLLIYQAELINSLLINIGNGKEKFFQLFDLIISQSRSLNSKFFYGRSETISIKNLNFIDNHLIDTELIAILSNVILLQNFCFTNNYFRNHKAFMYYHAILEIQTNQFKFINNSINIGGSFLLFESKNIVNFNDMYLQNIKIAIEKQIWTQIIMIYGNKITVKNLQLDDLSAYTSLIRFETYNLFIDNFLLSNINILENYHQIEVIQVLYAHYLQIQDLHINNIEALSKIENRYLVHQLFFIQSYDAKMFNILIQNTNTSNVIYFSISIYKYLNITKLYAQNLSALQLFYIVQQQKISVRNQISNLNFDQVNFILPIINYEQQTSSLHLVVSNLNIRNSILISQLILINQQLVKDKALIKIEHISANQIQAKTLIQTYISNSVLLIKDVIVLKSKLAQFLLNSLTDSNNILLIDIALKKVNFTDIDKYSILMGSFQTYLSKISVHYCLNFSVLILSINFKIQKILIRNSQILDIQFQYFQEIIYQTIFINKILICRDLYLVNNTQITKQPQISLLLFNLTQHQHDIQGLLIYNNSFQKVNIVELKGQFILQIFFINNNCESQCLLKYNNNNIQLRQYVYQFINLDEYSYFMDNSSKFINTQDTIRDNSQTKLLINSKISFHNWQKHNLLYLPSGQQLGQYKLYDFINQRSIDFINSIKIVQYEYDQSYIIQGGFMINTFEYNIIQQKVIRNLSQYQNFIQFEQAEQQFGLEDFQLIFNPYQENILMIDIQKVHDPSIKLQIYAKTQKCQIGEIFVLDQCLVCDPELQIYSTKQKSNFCSRVDQQMISDHKQGSIKLKKGYWRPFVYSSIIENCESKENCQGGWHPGDVSCNVGYLGGNCNACDSFNIRGDGYFQLENLQCNLCGKFNYFKFAFKLSFILIIYFIRLILQTNSNILNYRKHLLQKLVNYRHYFVLAKFISDRSSMVLNISIRNFALIGLIVQDIFDLPEIFTIFTSPMILEKNSSLCLNTFVNNNHSIWIIASKILMVILTFNLYTSFIVMTNQKQMKNYFIFPIISLFLFQGPTITVLSIQQTIYVTYSNVRYTYFDYAIRYFSSGHQRNLIYFILPLLISFLIILPLILFHIMKKQSQHLLKGRVFIQIGSFILPYRYYYQELINYFRNILLLQLLLLNSKQIAQLNKINIFMLITYIYKQNRIYKIKIISNYETQQGILLIGIMYLSMYINHLEEAGNITIYFISLFYIIFSLKQYIYLLFKDNKLQIYEFLQNRRKLLYYLKMKNYNQCLSSWKNLKLNHKYLVERNNQRVYQNQIREASHIILQKQNIQTLDNARYFSQEIEMREM